MTTKKLDEEAKALIERAQRDYKALGDHLETIADPTERLLYYKRESTRLYNEHMDRLTDLTLRYPPNDAPSH